MVKLWCSRPSPTWANTACRINAGGSVSPDDVRSPVAGTRGPVHRRCIAALAAELFLGHKYPGRHQDGREMECLLGGGRMNHSSRVVTGPGER
jgi:hypothetical protein